MSEEKHRQETKLISRSCCCLGSDSFHFYRISGTMRSDERSKIFKDSSIVRWGDDRDYVLLHGNNSSVVRTRITEDHSRCLGERGRKGGIVYLIGI